ncbi:hypothetical protein [Sorangium atrum]|uniref:Protein kinase domain-containing protein n=1 Tax=Sorangium atrum TaxID=2995308 RepID=A0ABT5CD68_9BACT|nr:hypothetical protein [Sorangium aterium]MDC0683898.1 hypothetical protein [Sorangium aterium]
METLAARIARAGPLPDRDAVGWVVRLAKRVESLHARGTVHGRLSAACVVMEGEPCTSTGWLSDPLATPAFVGYRSPERAAGEGPSRRDDTWALAVTLYTALSGALPFPAESDQELRRKQGAGAAPRITPPGAAGDALWRVLDQALARGAEQRITEVAALRRALEAARPDDGLEELPPLDEHALAAPARTIPAPRPSSSGVRGTSSSQPPRKSAPPREGTGSQPPRKSAPPREGTGSQPPRKSAPPHGHSSSQPPPIASASARRTPLPLHGLASLGLRSTTGAPTTPPPEAPDRPSKAQTALPAASPRLAGARTEDGARAGAVAAPTAQVQPPPVVPAATAQPPVAPTGTAQLPFAPVATAQPPVAPTGTAQLPFAPVATTQPPFSPTAVPLFDADAPASPRTFDDLPWLGEDDRHEPSHPFPMAPGGAATRVGAPELGAPTPHVPAVDLLWLGEDDTHEPSHPFPMAPGGVAARGGASGLGAPPRAATPPFRAPAPAPGASREAPSAARRWVTLALGVVAIAGAAGAAWFWIRHRDAAPPSLPAPPSGSDAAPAACAAPAAPSAPAPGDAGAEDAGTATPADAGTASTAPDPAATADFAACAMPLFPGKSVDAATAGQLLSVCAEIDPMKGVAALKSHLAQAAGPKGVSDATKEWAVLGWHDMATLATLRARCCHAPPPLELPPTPEGCTPLDEALNELGAAVASASAPGDRAVAKAARRYMRAAQCVARVGAATRYGRKDKPNGGEASAFKKVLSRALRSAAQAR